jgi:hypothetical protein
MNALKQPRGIEWDGRLWLTRRGPHRNGFRRSGRIMPSGHAVWAFLRSGIGDAVQRTFIREPPLPWGRLPALSGTHTQASSIIPVRSGTVSGLDCSYSGLSRKVSGKRGQEATAGMQPEGPACAASKCDHPSRL